MNSAPDYDPLSEQTSGQMRFAERFTAAYSGTMLHAHGIGWHTWDGTRWASCGDGGASRAVRRLTRLAYRELPDLDKAEQGRLLRDIRRVESANGVAGVLSLAGCFHPCTVAADRLDGNPHILNTAGGTVVLTEGTVRDADPLDRCSKVTRAKFSPDAHSDVFEAFITRIQPDPQMRAFLARQLGSALLGKVREQHLFIWYGTGANGKTTLRDAVSHAMGDYAIEVPPYIMMQSKYGEQALGPERMRLKGARLVFCSEIPSGSRMDEAMMKRLTGGDPITAKLLYKDPVEFTPSHTLFMLTNHLPRVYGDDPATWRRLLAVPFDQVIPAGEMDGELPEKLTECVDAVFAWVWGGWLDYLENGLRAPGPVLEATQAYKLASDPVGRFLADAAAVVVAFGASVGSRQLYDAFLEWAVEEGEPTKINHKTFTGMVEAHGWVRRHGVSGSRWQGLGLAAGEDRNRGVS